MMEYQKIINLLDNTPNRPTKFSTKNWVEIDDESRGTYNTNSQIKFKISMLRSSLCDYSDAYMLVSGTITVAALTAGRGNNNMQVVFKNCAPFTDCISEIYSAQIDNAKDIDVIMPMYNLIEYSNNYSKKSGILWQYYRDEPTLNDADDTLVNFSAYSASFKFKQKVIHSTGDDGTKAVRIMVLLKHLSNFQRTPETPLINFEINLILKWYVNCVVSNADVNENTTFAITDTKIYVPVVTSSTEDNVKLSQQLKQEFIRTINWNKYHPKAETINASNQYLDHLIEPSSQGVNRLSILPFNALGNRTGHSRYLPTEKTKML